MKSSIALSLFCLTVSSVSAWLSSPASRPATRLFDGAANGVEEAVETTFKGAAALSGLTKEVKTVFTTEDIDKILPHRYPFALVDKVVEYEAGKRAVGIKCVTKVRPLTLLMLML
jgi:hypothetical protein